MLSKKTSRFLEKISAALAILHAIRFDEYSDVSFWRESTLMKVSSFEEKEQKLIDSQNDLHFFENCILFFPTIICVFLDKNINSKLVSDFEQKDPKFLQKVSEKF